MGVLLLLLLQGCGRGGGLAGPQGAWDGPIAYGTEEDAVRQPTANVGAIVRAAAQAVPRRAVACDRHERDATGLILVVGRPFRHFATGSVLAQVVSP